jgi:hypothetical protein
VKRSYKNKVDYLEVYGAAALHAPLFSPQIVLVRAGCPLGPCRMEINFQNFLLSELRNRKKMSSTDKMEVMKTSFLLFVVSGLYSKSQRISEPEL